MLSFDLADEGRTIRIYFDEEGMAKLNKAMEEVRADGDHIHLRTAADGGTELDETTPRGKKAIYEVVLNWVRD
jgi:tRNA-dihydrouridine synthase